MVNKTLALAARQTFQQLEALLDEPCPGACKTLVDSQHSWTSVKSYGDARSPAHCPYSWGHCQSLPDALVTDPGSLKVRLCNCVAQPERASGWADDRLLLQVPELRAACRSLGLRSSGELARLQCQTRQSAALDPLAAGSKAELAVTILARFGLTAPASASHKLIFHYAMHDTILAGWMEELAISPGTDEEFECRCMLKYSGHQYTPWRSNPPLKPGVGPFSLEEFRAVDAPARAELAGIFDSYAAMQRAVCLHRQTVAGQAEAE